MDESATMSAWIAEEVKNWTQALANLAGTDFKISQKGPIELEIFERIRSLLGIADDK